ncbi:AI-2E family transporter [Niveibacterium sp. SC-1]|uniref:AI-2E family transporter n=1 Tax=Niveibacterium sp. SC-1 TaxID=3135646 RepID=UPI00311EE33E
MNLPAEPAVLVPDAAPLATPRAPRLRSTRAVRGLFVLAILYSLYFAKAVFLPIALALLFAFALRPVVRALHRLRVPEGVAAGLVVFGLLAVLGVGLHALANPAMDWMEGAPQTLREVERKIGKFKRSVETVQRATDKIDDLASVGRKPSTHAAPARDERSLSLALFNSAPSFFLSAFAIVVLLLFLLASGDHFLRKIVKVLPQLRDKIRAVEVARAIELEVGRYLFATALINLGLGAATAAVMGLLGLPNPVLWGVMVATLNFIPYLGATVSLAVLSLVALVSFDSLGQALVVPAVFLGLTTLEGQLIQPLVMGRHFAVTPVLIFVALLFWGWMWGIAGAVMAVPILVAIKILATHIPSLAPLREFLDR